MLIVLSGSNGDIAVNISDFWSDHQGLGVRGWVSAESGPPDDLEFVFEDSVVPVTSWYARPDIAQKAPIGFRGKAWGFWCYLPSRSTPSLLVRRRGSKLRDSEPVQLKRHPAKIPAWQATKSPSPFEQFREEV